MSNLQDEIARRKLGWNEKHVAKNMFALSGSKYEDMIRGLRIDNLLMPGMRVLEVGVGLGFVTEGLCRAGYRVSALDISEVGLERVKQCCEYTYLLEDLEKMPSNYFDIIICGNVVQHTPTELLRHELSHLMRTLKAGGVFAMEFVSSNTSEDTGIDYVYGDAAENYCRTPKYMETLIGELGGTCEMIVDNKCDSGIVTGCHVFHVRKRRRIKFSIVIPTKNRPRFLEKAINAILAQDHDNWELIIVDDSDTEYRPPDDKRIKYIWRHERGITSGLNLGLNKATGDILNWANDDDVLVLDALSYVAQHIGDAKWCYGNTRGVDVFGNSTGWTAGREYDYRTLQISHDFIPQPSVFFTKEAFEKAGKFDERFEHASDYEFWLRLGKTYTPIYFNRIMALYTQHPDQGTVKFANLQDQEGEAIRRMYR